MCIAFWTFNQDPAEDEYDFILAFNRDEHFERPTKGFHIWSDVSADVYAPKDLKPPVESQRGAWIGVNRHGHLALLTNYREPLHHHDGRISRGALVRDFLLGKNPSEADTAKNGMIDPIEYAQIVYKNRHRYDGFNLMLFDLRPGCTQVVYVTNRNSSAENSLSLDQPGSIEVLDCRNNIMGLSNSTLYNKWTKVSRGIEHLRELFSGTPMQTSNEKELLSSIAGIMRDSTPFSESNPPHMLNDLEQCIFVPRLSKTLQDSDPLADAYGTRTTNILLLHRDRLTVAECNHDTPEDHDDLNSLDVSYFDFSF